MPTLDVPGATLEYTTTGSGPLHIILVPGAPGSQSVFRFLVPFLSRSMTVTTYSRRGLSGSLLRGAQDYAHRLDTDADDLATLLKAVVVPGDGDTTAAAAGACIFGTSSGAIVSLRFLERHPDYPIRKCVAHEPPAITVLPPEVLAQREPEHRALTGLYRDKGAPYAVETFASFFADGKDREALPVLLDPAASADARADVMYWLEREPPYVFQKWDLEALKKAGDKLVLSVGESTKDQRAGEATLALMERLGRSEETLFVAPGGHIPYVTEPEALATALSNLLI
ncbi:Alpha beta hydrolase fold protein [Lasiodiplodia theobromae]|uniref:Alpha beta hydrolase fold protein n=1 Tax=Lasiodiplodia theobromae TaxID=45133 RepID=UPI0015C3C985|nr:Alpha beta hydrolase fold protein [Lasiodiplodia theobromae]KAF4546556.1 Alpha beta hydrolase fold protein [Lasiodiplodia theobromae]